MSLSLVIDPAATQDSPPSQDNAVSAPPSPPQTDDSIPEKFRGKSVQDIIQMYQNAEQELGRARNEVGTVRRLADELIGVRREELRSQQRSQEPARQPLTPDALLDNPEQAITSVVRAEADARTQSIAERTARLEAELALERFEKKFPDYQSTMNDPAFTQWVQSSPYRQRLAYAAANNGDFSAADELFTIYKDSQAGRQPAPSQQHVDAARRATLARSGGSSASGVSQTEGGGKKIWSRQELIEMRIRQPEKFDALYESEILPAYREKRVR